MNMIAEPMISWLEQSKTCTESSQRHRVQQLDHSLIRLMVAVEEALHEYKVLAVVADQLLVTTTKL